MRALIGPSLSFLVLAIIFAFLERGGPGTPPGPWRRPGFGVDLLYWLLTPLVTRALSRTTIALGVIAAFALAGAPVDWDAVRAGFGPLARQPPWLQAVEIVILSDFIGYWLHRWFHQGPLWAFHAVHHSSSRLDWLASVRVHPVNDILARFVQAAVVLSLGFAPLAVAGALPALTLYAILIHADVPWNWGPLRHVIASPVYHRWHHTRAEAGGTRNFAGLLPLWDHLFGTLHRPAAGAPDPTMLGTDEPVPAGFIGQLAYPFRRLGARGAEGGQGG